MAIDTLRASGNNQYGQMSDLERANFGSQQQAQDFILRKRMQDEALAHEDAIRNQGLSAQERMQATALAAQKDMTGSFQDRSALEDKRLERTISPQMEALRQSQSRYDTEHGDTQGKRDFESEILKQRVGLLSGTPGMGFTDPKIAERARYATLTGQELPESPEDKLIQQVIASLAGQAAGGGDIGALKGLLGAAKSGDINQIPTNIGPEPQARSLEDIQGIATSNAARFAKSDASTIGWNPTRDDINIIVKQRDDLAKALKARTPRISDMQARDAANQIIDEQLAPQAGSVGTGWIKALRQQLGLLPSDEPAAAPTRPNATPMMGF